MTRPARNPVPLSVLALAAAADAADSLATVLSLCAGTATAGGSAAPGSAAPGSGDPPAVAFPPGKVIPGILLAHC